MIISNDLEDAAEKAVAVAEIYSQATKVRNQPKRKMTKSLSKRGLERCGSGSAMVATCSFSRLSRPFPFPLSLSPSLCLPLSLSLSLCAVPQFFRARLVSFLLDFWRGGVVGFGPHRRRQCHTPCRMELRPRQALGDVDASYPKSRCLRPSVGKCVRGIGGDCLNIVAAAAAADRLC